MTTLTNANSILMLSVGGIFPVPQSLQGYATDDAFASPDVEPAQAVMGVDGRLSGGFTPYPTEIEITLQADSTSAFVFDSWMAAQNTVREVFYAELTIQLPGTRQKFALSKGILTSASPMPTGKKILQPRKWKITFESCSPAPY